MWKHKYVLYIGNVCVLDITKISERPAFVNAELKLIISECCILYLFLGITTKKLWGRLDQLHTANMMGASRENEAYQVKLRRMATFVGK
jgi:hypothetical protein